MTTSLIAVTVVMFGLATAHYGVVTHVTWKIFGDELSVGRVRVGPTEIASYCFEGINVR